MDISKPYICQGEVAAVLFTDQSQHVTEPFITRSSVTKMIMLAFSITAIAVLIAHYFFVPVWQVEACLSSTLGA